MRKILLLLLLFVCHQIIAQSNCSSERYRKQVFQNVIKISQVYYGSADPYGIGTPLQDLYMDIYEPAGDTLQERPLIVYAYGGAFLIGNKIQPPIPDYCEAFAKMGYVVAAIDYRIGFNIASTGSAIRAVYRAAQDLRASVRFLCQRNTQYRIDTASVILTGSSAGCFAGLHSNYFEEWQRPQETYGIPLEQTDLGCFDCAGNADFGKRVPRIRAIVNHWGALLDTLLIENEPDENCPVISFHGDGDLLVPYGTGNPFSYPVFPNVYGSQPIHRRLTNLGIKNQFVSLDGFGHEPWLLEPRLLDTAYLYTGIFLQDVLRPEPQKISGKAIACVGEMVDLSALLRDRSSYCWTVQGKASNVKINGGSVNFQCADTGVVTVTVAEKNYLDVWSEPVQFVVQIIPKAVANFGVVNVNQLAINVADSAKNATGKIWLWGDGISAAGNATNHNYTTPGNYTITQIATNQACSDTFSRIVEVDTCPTANFSYQLEANELQLFAQSTNGETYEWNVAGTNVTGQNPVVILSNQNVLVVQLTVTNKAGCSRSIVQFVTISSINALAEESFNVFPTHFSGSFNIESIQGSRSGFELMDANGRMLLRDTFDARTTVSTNMLQAGFYFLKVKAAQREHIFKLVKTRN